MGEEFLNGFEMDPSSPNYRTDRNSDLYALCDKSAAFARKISFDFNLYRQICAKKGDPSGRLCFIRFAT